MMATRLKQFGLLLFSMLICGVAFFQMFERTTGGFPQNYLWMLAFVGALFLTSWGLPLRFQPYANQAIMCCVMVLTGTGIMMIARIDQDLNTSVAFKPVALAVDSAGFGESAGDLHEGLPCAEAVLVRQHGDRFGVAAVTDASGDRFRTVWRAHLGEDSRFGIVPAKRVREAVPRVFLRLLPV